MISNVDVVHAYDDDHDMLHTENTKVTKNLVVFHFNDHYMLCFVDVHVSISIARSYYCIFHSFNYLFCAIISLGLLCTNISFNTIIIDYYSIDQLGNVQWNESNKQLFRIYYCVKKKKIETTHSKIDDHNG